MPSSIPMRLVGPKGSTPPPPGTGPNGLIRSNRVKKPRGIGGMPSNAYQRTTYAKAGRLSNCSNPQNLKRAGLNGFVAPKKSVIGGSNAPPGTTLGNGPSPPPGAEANRSPPARAMPRPPSPGTPTKNPSIAPKLFSGPRFKEVLNTRNS